MAKERRSRAELERSAHILESMPIGLCYLDVELRYVYFNEAFAKLTGLRSDTHLGLTVRQVMPEVADQVEHELRRVIATREPLTRGMLAAPTPAHPTERRHYQHSFSAIVDGDDNVAGVACVVYDATDRHQTEEALHESKDAVRDLYDSAPDMFLSVSPQGGIQKCNRTLLETLGYASEEIIGRHVLYLYDPTCLAEARKVFQDFVAGKETTAADLRLRRKDGSTLDVSLNVSIVRNPDGTVRYSSSTLRDVTEQKRLEARLRHAQKLESIGQLAAGIAHEINTPAQFVLDNTTFLKEAFADVVTVETLCRETLGAAAAGELDAARVDKLMAALDASDFDFLRTEIPLCLDQTLDGISRIATIVRAMKTFSHPGQYEKTFANLNEAIENCITLSSNEWRYVATIDAKLDAELPATPCFRNEFEQVIVNLIVNAAHAISDKLDAAPGGRDALGKGRITISTSRVGGTAEVRVQDTGMGIPAAIRERIFDPFFTTKPVGKGTGQGLALAHAVIVKKHGGELEVETEVGVGTTFIIRLPLEDERNAAAA